MNRRNWEENHWTDGDERSCGEDEELEALEEEKGGLEPRRGEHQEEVGLGEEQKR
jgi:hypothetical protein